MMQETSLLAYSQLDGKFLRGARCEVYYCLMSATIPLTDREITRRLGYRDPNRVRPRRNELVKLGLVVSSGKRVCMVSGKKVVTWRVK